MIYNLKDEVIACFETKALCMKYLGITSSKSFDCIISRLKSGQHDFCRIKGSQEKVKINIIEVEDED